MEWTMFAVVAALGIALLIWQKRGLVSEEAARGYLKQGALVVDVRSAAEYQQGHLSGAVNIPVGELAAGIGRHVSRKDQVLLLHCVSGGRSGMAQRTLRRLGYANAFNLGSYGRAERILKSSHE